MPDWLLILPILFFSVVIHECAHGYVALKNGDPTAKNAGRLTLNPIPHIDPVGTLLVPAMLILSGSSFFFAWAKPVPVNPHNLRRPGRDDMLVSFAGPASNILLAMAFTVLFIILGKILFPLGLGNFINTVLFPMARYGIMINMLLAFFNLMPIAPLDGSHILSNLLPEEAARKYNQINRYGFVILLLLIVSGLTRVVFVPAMAFASGLIGIIHLFF